MIYAELILPEVIVIMQYSQLNVKVLVPVNCREGISEISTMCQVELKSYLLIYLILVIQQHVEREYKAPVVSVSNRLVTAAANILETVMNM